MYHMKKIHYFIPELIEGFYVFSSSQYVTGNQVQELPLLKSWKFVIDLQCARNNFLWLTIKKIYHHGYFIPFFLVLFFKPLNFLFVLDSTLWWPSGRYDKLISIDEQNLFLWSLDSSRKTAQVRFMKEFSESDLPFVKYIWPPSEDLRYFTVLSTLLAIKYEWSFINREKLCAHLPQHQTHPCYKGWVS